jgi:FkbM family methyltransferase
MIGENKIADQLGSMCREARRLEREAAPFRRKIPAAPVILYGAGPLGEMTLAHLRRIGGLPVALADSNPKRWGTLLDGVPVLSPQEAVARYADTGRFVVTIYNGSPVRRQLQQLGCRTVNHFADLYFEYAAEFLPYCGLAPRSVVLDAAPELENAAQVWHDDRSRTEFLAQLAWRLRLPTAELPPADDPSECYFPDGPFSYLQNEVLIDCGAFDGDSLRQYLGRCPAAVGARIVALEPDSRSFQRLAGFVGQLPGRLAGQVRIEPWAVSERSGEVSFEALGTVRSGVQESGGARVTAVALDDIGVSPTMIKMDIEGFELSALKGATRILLRDRPVLAISLYHHATDLWTIPNLLKSLVPDYRLFLRRYAEDCWELVLYAVPASRLIGEFQTMQPTATMPCKP